MTHSLRASLAAFVFTCAVVGVPALAAISASADPTKPSQTSSYSLTGPVQQGFPVIENVEQNPNFGPWHKELVNDRGSGIPSGNDVPIAETLTNTGAAPWTDWHERIISRTQIDAPDDAPGFLFTADSLDISANYGAGFVTLMRGVDYVRTVTPYSGPPISGNNGNWEAINIVFAPTRAIGSGNVLRIDKRIFEVFGDGDIWQTGPDAAAVIGEFPTITVPEPGMTLAMLVAAFAGLTVRQRGPLRP